QRSRELGIRMALGARARDVASHVLARGLRLVLQGLALGAGVILALAPGPRSFLSRAATLDGWTYPGAPGVALPVAAARRGLAAGEAGGRGGSRRGDGGGVADGCPLRGTPESMAGWRARQYGAATADALNPRPRGGCRHAVHLCLLRHRSELPNPPGERHRRG